MLPERAPDPQCQLNGSAPVGEVECGGAPLVHLAEAFYVRILATTCAMAAVGCGLALWFATLERGVPRASTVAFVAAAAAFCAVGITRPHALYVRLRARVGLQISPAVLASLALLLDGPESQCWWFALPMMWTVCTLASTPIACGASVVTAGAFLLGTALAGAPLAGAGNTGALPAAVALPAYTLVARIFIDGFARLTLGGHPLVSAALRPRPAPVWVPNLEPAPPKRAPGVAATAPIGAAFPRGATRLTARQLEVALLLCDGLRQTEIAECLAISTRQVERLAAGARERVGAATTYELVALLISDELTLASPEQALAVA